MGGGKMLSAVIPAERAAREPGPMYHRSAVDRTVETHPRSVLVDQWVPGLAALARDDSQ
jgi:hypothetical protein